MSIEALCSKETITVQLETASTGAEFGVATTPSTVSTPDCFVQELDSSEVLEYESLGLKVSHILLFSSDPSIGRQHRILLSDSTKLEVIGAYREGRPGEKLLWIVLGNSITTRDR